MMWLLGALVALSLSKGDTPYEYAWFSFPDTPHRACGVQYRAGDAASAMPLGGLGTGTIYLDSRGQFARPSIANTYRPAGGVMNGCGFSIKAGGVKKPLAEIAMTYLGHFPIADVEGSAPGFPLSVRLRAMSPFVLGDSKLSGTPAAMFRFRLKNVSKKRQIASVTFRWTSPTPQRSDGRGASGNVDGFLTWRIGELAPGSKWNVPVKFVAAANRQALPVSLAHPNGDLILDDDGAFTWEDKGKQCLATPAGPCLSQHGFYLHYDGGRAGTGIVGQRRLDNLARTGRDGDTVRLKSVDGVLKVDVLNRDGTITYTIENAGAVTIRNLRLSVYANFEANHDEGNDRGWLDRGLHALIVTDDSGAVCALSGPASQLEGGWCGVWPSTIPRLATGQSVAAWDWGAQAVFVRTAHAGTVTCEQPSDGSGCTLDGLDGSVRDTSPQDDKAVACLTSTANLKPGETKVVRFVLAWYYPDARDSDGKVVGHQYANWFSSSLAVARHVAQQWDGIAKRVGGWQARIYDEPKVPGWLKDQLVNSLYSLARNTAWLKDGRFSHSESFIGCPITETIVCRFYGSIPLAMFFPDLDRNNMVQFMRHQRADGAIPFAFGAPERWDSPFYDTQKILDSFEFALMAWRDYTWWSDPAWAREVYPAVTRAILFAKTLDTDGDGVINDELSLQYYDCWQFTGVSSYTGIIWLAALKAGAAFARLEGDGAFQAECEAMLAKAQMTIEEKLWTGSYYRLYNNTLTGERSDTSLAAQLTGQWYAYLCGLGEVLPKDHILTALKWIGDKNGAGKVWALMNGVLPDGRRDLPLCRRRWRDGLRGAAGAQHRPSPAANVEHHLEHGPRHWRDDVGRRILQRHVRVGPLGSADRPSYSQWAEGHERVDWTVGARFIAPSLAREYGNESFSRLPAWRRRELPLGRRRATGTRRWT